MFNHPDNWKFYKMYANLPISIRDEIVAVIDNEPMSFRVVKIELDNKTEMGFKALQQMIKLKFL